MGLFDTDFHPSCVRSSHTSEAHNPGFATWVKDGPILMNKEDYFNWVVRSGLQSMSYLARCFPSAMEVRIATSGFLSSWSYKENGVRKTAKPWPLAPSGADVDGLDTGDERRFAERLTAIKAVDEWEKEVCSYNPLLFDMPSNKGEVSHLRGRCTS